MQKLGVPASHADSYFRAMDLNGDGQFPPRTFSHGCICLYFGMRICAYLDAHVHGCVLMKHLGTALLFALRVAYGRGHRACMYLGICVGAWLDAHVHGHVLMSHTLFFALRVWVWQA